MTNNKPSQKEITLKDIYETSINTNNTLKELLKWTKFAGLKNVKSVLDEQLLNDNKKLIYHLSDGKKGTQEIAKIVGVSHVSVFNYWKEWEKAGIGESISVTGGSRFKRSFDLEDFGIKVPEISKQNTSIQEAKIEEPPKQEALPNGN